MSSSEEDYETPLDEINISGVQAYQFEPLITKRGHCQVSEESDVSGNTSSEEDQVNDVTAQGNTQVGCHCQNCVQMATERENRCCHSYKAIANAKGSHQCITEHPGFEANCLNIYVLLTSKYEYIQADGPFGDDIHDNE